MGHRILEVDISTPLTPAIGKKPKNLLKKNNIFKKKSITDNLPFHYIETNTVKLKISEH